jgi:hypothetical protein
LLLVHDGLITFLLADNVLYKDCKIAKDFFKRTKINFSVSVSGLQDFLQFLKSAFPTLYQTPSAKEALDDLFATMQNAIDSLSIFHIFDSTHKSPLLITHLFTFSHCISSCYFVVAKVSFHNFTSF